MYSLLYLKITKNKWFLLKIRKIRKINSHMKT